MSAAIYSIVLGTFVMLKVTGTFAAWSWWWLLMPLVPDLYFVFTKAGWL